MFESNSAAACERLLGSGQTRLQQAPFSCQVVRSGYVVDWSLFARHTLRTSSSEGFDTQGVNVQRSHCIQFINVMH
jgi:hypothetical protein